MRAFFSLLLVLTGLTVTHYASAAEDFIIGQINSPTNPTVGENASAMRVGAKVAADRLNQSGGVRGRQIRLINGDDQYDAAKTAELAKEMFASRGASVLINVVGTPGTLKTASDVLESSQGALIGPIGSDAALSQPGVFPLRARYSDEIARLVQQIKSVNGSVGIVYFKAGTGPALAEQAGNALKEHGVPATMNVGYDVDKDVQKMREAIAPLAQRLKASGAKGVLIIAGGSAFDAALIETRNAMGQGATIYGMSMVVWDKLVQRVGPKLTDGVVLSQSVMYPFAKGSSVVKPIVREFREDMGKWAPGQALSYPTFEGYLAVRLAAKAAEKSKTFTPSAIRAALESMGSFDLGGLDLRYSRVERRGMGRADVTMIAQGMLIR